MEIVQKKTTLKGLVVSTLWKIWVSWGDEIPNIWKHNPDVPNHQPEFKSCLFKNGLHRVPLLCLIIGGSSHYLVHPDHKSSVWEVFWSQWGFTRFAHTKSAATDHHWLNHQLNVGYTGAIKKKKNPRLSWRLLSLFLLLHPHDSWTSTAPGLSSVAGGWATQRFLGRWKSTTNKKVVPRSIGNFVYQAN